MPRYRRADVPGATYFFTLVTYRRQSFLCEPDVRQALREAIRKAQALKPFKIDAWVLLPDHLHCLWSLPEGDKDFPGRWAAIKRHVTRRCRRLHREEWMTSSKRRRKESTIW